MLTIGTFRVSLCRRAHLLLLLLHTVLLRGNNLRSNHPCLFYRRPGFGSRSPFKKHPSLGASAVCSLLSARGIWSSDHVGLHINYLQLETVFFALKTLQRLPCGTHVLVQTNNTTVMHYLNRMGVHVQGTRSRTLEWLVREIILWCQTSNISLTAVHISDCDNVQAHHHSRHRVEHPHHRRIVSWLGDSQSSLWFMGCTYGRLFTTSWTR